VSRPCVNCSQKRASKGPFRSLKLLTLAVFGLFSGSSTELHADEVWLRNGHQLTGKIISIDMEKLVLEVPEGKLTLKRSQVDYVVRIPAKESMLEECNRRLLGGFPGSALSYLRKEYILDQDCPAILDLYRKCLIAEIDQLLLLDSSEAALLLWRELSSLPGNDGDLSSLRSRVLKEQDRLMEYELMVLRSIELGSPREALQHLQSLEERFPSESQSWTLVYEEQSLMAAQDSLQLRDFSSLHETLMNLLKRSPHYWTHCRSALTLAAIHGHGIAIEDTLTILPDSPAVHLALAHQSGRSETPIQMGSHLERVTELVGGEINSKEIERELTENAFLELRGLHKTREDFQSIATKWLDRFWSRYAFPGSPPKIPAIVEHPTQEALDDYLGSPGDSIRLESIGEYGKIEQLVLHLVTAEPMLSQDGLPRELFRSLIERSFGVSRCPAWLEEGLATLARGPLAANRDDWLLEKALLEGRIPDISDLITMEEFSSELLRAACGSVVETILESTPRTLIPLKLKRIRDEGLERFLRRHTEIDTLHKLQQRWIGDLRQRRG